MQVLLVEDDDSIAESLVASLTDAGHRVQRVASGGAALGVDPGDFVLLDLGLPDMDGYDVCRSLRAASSVPIIVITARSEEFDRVLGLELGADDYVVKPFGFRELHARMRAVVRRSGSQEGPDSSDQATDTLSIGGLEIDQRAHRARLGGEELALTPKEFDLLAYLATDPGAVHSRIDIVEHVWDANWFGPTKTVDAHVAALRRKLGDPRWIEAVRGVGFRFDAPPDPS